MSSCSGWIVATMSRIGPLRGRSISARSSGRTPLPSTARELAAGPGRGAVPPPPRAQRPALVAGELPAADPEAAAPHQPLRIGSAGLVERPAHGRPPVDD